MRAVATGLAKGSSIDAPAALSSEERPACRRSLAEVWLFCVWFKFELARVGAGHWRRFGRGPTRSTEGLGTRDSVEMFRAAKRGEND
jgi:hypothetical protein